MGYTLEAVLSKEALQHFPFEQYRSARLVKLAQGVSMLPLSAALYKELSPQTSREKKRPFAQFWKLSQPALALIESLSEFGRIIYVEAEYWAGEGTQATAGWEAGQLVIAPLKETHRGLINQALRFLEVSPQDYLDEFLAVGLARYRNTEAWLNGLSLSE